MDEIRVQKFDRTLRYWIQVKSGFQDWLELNVASACDRLGSEFARALSEMREHRNYWLIAIQTEFLSMPFGLNELSRDQSIIMTGVELSCIKHKSPFRVSPNTSDGERFWKSISTPEQSSVLVENLNVGIRDMAEDYFLPGLLDRIEEYFTRDTLDELNDAVTTLEGLRRLTLKLRQRAAKDWGIVAGSLKRLHLCYYELADKDAETIPSPPVAESFREVVGWLNALVLACEDHPVVKWQNALHSGVVQPPATVEASAELQHIESHAIPTVTTGDLPDGTFGLDGFRLGGVTMLRISRQQRRLLELLNAVKDKTNNAVSVDDLIGIGLVWDDDTVTVGNAIGAMRTRVNRMLKEAKAGYHIETRGRNTLLALVRSS